MSKKIKVVLLNTENSNLEVVENFEHSLENMQKAVGGYLEALSLFEDSKGRRVTLWLNEEGKLNGLPPNFAIMRKSDKKLLDYVMGNVIITSSSPNGTTLGLNQKELNLVMNSFDMDFGTITPLFVTKTLFI